VELFQLFGGEAPSMVYGNPEGVAPDATYGYLHNSIRLERPRYFHILLVRGILYPNDALIHNNRYPLRKRKSFIPQRRPALTNNYDAHPDNRIASLLSAMDNSENRHRDDFRDRLPGAHHPIQHGLPVLNPGVPVYCNGNPVCTTVPELHLQVPTPVRA
jgi:hypothetical protein